MFKNPPRFITTLSGSILLAATLAWGTPTVPPSTPKVTKKPTASPTKENFSRYGRTLSVSIAPVVTLDSQAASDFSSKVVINGIQEALYKFDEAQNLVPVLALTLPQMEDETTYLICLRKGVYFHDGSEFDADSVVYTVERLLQSDNRSPYRSYLTGQLKSVKTLDKYTVQVRLMHPYVDVGMLFTRMELYPLSPKSVEGYKAAYGKVIAVGTGPFVFDEWDKKEKIVLKKFPRYRQPDPHYKPTKSPAKSAEGNPAQTEIAPQQLNLPYLNVLQFKFHAEESQALNELHNKRLSAVGGITPQSATIIHNQSRVLSHPGLCLNQIYLNIKEPPLDNLNVRLALAHAVDRDGLVREVFSGFALPAQSCIPSWHWAHNPDYPGMDYQPETAQDLLSQAGYDEQHPLVFELLCTDEPLLTAQARLVVNQWAKVGIKAKLVLLNKNELFSRLYGQNGKRNFTAALEDWQGGLNPDSFSYDLYSPKSAYNKVGYDNMLLELLFYNARSSFSRTEKAIFYHQAEKLITSDVSTVYLVFTHNIWAYNSYVMDLQMDYQGLADFGRVWVTN
ncbi:MAG: ABC transporter substrate-binding protein [Candidatus Schekmanbacteria bacterium]|nr:ABC transporter substrate-binding protein [Candidatus Schekmanbacteria bacterium]